MKHVKSNVNILKPLQEKLQNNKGNMNMKISKSNKNIKNSKNNLKISEQEMKLINNKNNLLINFCEKSCKNSFSSLAFINNNNNNNKNIKNSVSPKKKISFNKKNKTSTNTIFNTNNNNFIENNNNNSNRGISIRLNFKNKIINNNFSRKNRINKNSKKMGQNPHTPKNINLVNSGIKPDFNFNEKIKEKDKQITLLQKDLLQSQKLLNQLQEEKQKEISSTYNSIKRVDSFINNNNNNNNSYLNNNNNNTSYNRMKKYSSLSNFFVSKTDKNLNVLRTFYGKNGLISNKSNSKRTIYNTNYNNKSMNRIKNLNKSRKKSNLNIFTNASNFAKFQAFKNNLQNKNKICKTRNNTHKNYNLGNLYFNSGTNSNRKKNKSKNFMRALSYSPNKILAQFLYQYETNCKTSKNILRKNINIKSASPSSAQNRVINKRMKNMINNKRSKDLEYIINKGEDLKNRMKNLLNNYISLSYEIKKNYAKTEIK